MFKQKDELRLIQSRQICPRDHCIQCSMFAPLECDFTVVVESDKISNRFLLSNWIERDWVKI